MAKIITGFERQMAVQRCRMAEIERSVHKMYGPEMKRIRENMQKLRDKYFHTTV